MRRTLAIIALTGMVIAGCGGDDEAAPTTVETATTTAPTTTTTESPDTAPASASVTVAESEVGTILVDGDGFALYLFVPDAQGDSTCYDQCEAAWPPLLGDVSSGDGVDDSLFGTTTRDDGSTQVTYNGWPLYYFANDAAAGDINGQGLNDVWYLLSPTGEGIGLETDVSASVTVAESEVGTILVDGDGFALYLFVPDAQGDSTCYDQCEAAWPPLLGDVSSGDGVDDSLFGTTTRDDGSTQVTYNGWPLYYFANDAAAGDINGQGLNDVWYLLSPTGEGIGLASG